MLLFWKILGLVLSSVEKKEINLVLSLVQGLQIKAVPSSCGSHFSLCPVVNSVLGPGLCGHSLPQSFSIHQPPHISLHFLHPREMCRNSPVQQYLDLKAYHQGNFSLAEWVGDMWASLQYGANPPTTLRLALSYLLQASAHVTLPLGSPLKSLK